MRSPLTLATLLGAALPAFAGAQDAVPVDIPPRHFTVGAGVTSADSVTGLGLTAGFGLRYGPLLVGANFVDLIVAKRDTDPYYQDEYGCRNGDNGQFADKENCSPIGFRFGVSGNINLMIPRTRVFIGGGGRAGEPHTSAYGSIGAALGSNATRPVMVRVNIGREYVSGMVTAGFGF